MGARRRSISTEPPTAHGVDDLANALRGVNIVLRDIETAAAKRHLEQMGAMAAMSALIERQTTAAENIERIVAEALRVRANGTTTHEVEEGRPPARSGGK